MGVGPLHHRGGGKTAVERFSHSKKGVVSQLAILAESKLFLWVGYLREGWLSIYPWCAKSPLWSGFVDEGVYLLREIDALRDLVVRCWS